jgi:hypothetical protein
MSALRKEAIDLQEYEIDKDYSPKKRIKTKN